MRPLKVVLSLVAALMLLATSIASAAAAPPTDKITNRAVATGHLYPGGKPAAGNVAYSSTLQLDRDPTGEVSKVRGAGRITKIKNASRVQVTRIEVLNGKTTVAVNTKAVNSGTALSAASSTALAGLKPGACGSITVVTSFLLTWSSGAKSAVTVKTPASRVCWPTTPPIYKNCGAMNAVFPHGMGKPGAVDHTTGKKDTRYYVSAFIYAPNAKRGRDADHDGIDCEKP